MGDRGWRDTGWKDTGWQGGRSGETDSGWWDTRGRRDVRIYLVRLACPSVSSLCSDDLDVYLHVGKDRLLSSISMLSLQVSNNNLLISLANKCSQENQHSQCSWVVTR